MQKKYKIVVSILLLVTCLCGCGPETPVPIHDALESTVRQNYEAAPKNAGVYIDTTPSMQGFLTRDNGALYSLCLHEIGKLVAGRYSEISYYRADTPLWLVEDASEDVLENARKLDYYKNSNGLSEHYKKIGSGEGYDSLNLTTALEEGRKQDLFLFITDFYENSIDNNVNASKLIAKLKSLAEADDGKVFGLIGIRSVFAGTIYDTGANGASVLYGDKDESQPPQYRPFYIILRGYPNHVQIFCDDFVKRLNGLGAQKGGDYEVSVFYEERFWGLDYTDLIQCLHLSPQKKTVWLHSSPVIIQDTGEREDDVKNPVYSYKKRTPNNRQQDRVLYFAYSVDSGHQEEFHALAESIGEIETVDFLPGNAEKELYVIPCQTQEKELTKLSDSGDFSRESGNQPGEKENFEIDGIYYDQDSETLYVALHLIEQQFSQGIWRLRWKNVLPAKESFEPWWERWHSASGPAADYSKTERLAEYIAPVIDSMSNIEQCVLNGTIYLNIEEG